MTMNIRFTPGGPTDTHDKLHDWTDELRTLSVRGAAGGAPLSLGDPYEVRYVSVEDVAHGRLIDGQHTARWRHLVSDGSHPHAELELDDTNAPMALHEGPGKDGFHAAVQAAEELEGDYVACVLASPPIRFIALWLHNDDEDLVMPYAPDQTGLEKYSPLTVDGALEVLSPMAAAVLEASAGEEPVGG